MVVVRSSIVDLVPSTLQARKPIQIEAVVSEVAIQQEQWTHRGLSQQDGDDEPEGVWIQKF
jgi:hypothetical protein